MVNTTVEKHRKENKMTDKMEARVDGILESMSKDLFTVSTDDKNGYVYLDPHCPHEFTIIFLHGLGDSANGFLAKFNSQELTKRNCRIVLPTAPTKPLTCKNGTSTTSWFDIYNISAKVYTNISDICKYYNQDDLNQSADLLLKLIEQEKLRFHDKNPARIFIGGFAHGCMVSLAAFLKY